MEDEGGSEREVESFEMDEMRGKRKGGKERSECT